MVEKDAIGGEADRIKCVRELHDGALLIEYQNGFRAFYPAPAWRRILGTIWRLFFRG